MTTNFYLTRSLSGIDRIYNESELLASSKYVIVLAEPGAGKTRLMESFALQLGATITTASMFTFGGAKQKSTPLIIDAFDELAKIDTAGLHRLFGKASEANPTHLYISSRSSEWDNASTNAFRELAGCLPLVVRLLEFTEAEQLQIFHDHVNNEDFYAFRAEVARFELEELLPNPQFLKLFADAYIESGRHFTDKRSIFSQAVDRLAKETNTNLRRASSTLTASQKVDLSSEVFAKLLLSGAQGLSTVESAENRMYPLLTSLLNNEKPISDVLTSRLFKPNTNADLHVPVHKIVVEYCAASYLTKRIVDPADSLTLNKCLPIIAPNYTVRDELRGLLGWMASLGNKHVQEAAINLDPYAVIANGDPSQLEQSSKRLLINRLKEIESKDPFFRRGDFWRRFSVAGFFAGDVLDEIKPLLIAEANGHLRDLILELMAGAPAITGLANELRTLVLDPNEKKDARILASRCLLNIAETNHYSDFATLVAESSNISLKIAAEMVQRLGCKKFERAYLADLLRACAKLYPLRPEISARNTEGRYFVRSLVESLDLVTTESLIEDLTIDVKCTCGKGVFRCECRTGISKVVGLLLDKYFDLAAPPFDSQKVWKWTKDLYFYGNLGPTQSRSVDVMVKDLDLRHGILTHVFGNLTDREQIREIKLYPFQTRSHCGLRFHMGDFNFLADLAFTRNNPVLWSSFLIAHVYDSKDCRGPSPLRRTMREHAAVNLSFMSEWAKFKRSEKTLKNEWKQRPFKDPRSIKRHRQQEKIIRATNIEYLKANRELVESGSHWRSLNQFATLTLMHPELIELEVGDSALVKNALKNCLDFIAPDIPNLNTLAELRCVGQNMAVEMVLFAACLEIVLAEGNLERVSIRLLQALRTNIGMSYSGVSEEHFKILKAEVDRLAFPDEQTAEDFIRRYIEPQLGRNNGGRADVWILGGEKPFNHLRPSLSIEWLNRFAVLEIDPLNRLFETAVQYADRKDLIEVIKKRCNEYRPDLALATASEEVIQVRIFWFIRAWLFMNDAPDFCWEWLKEDRNNVLVISTLYRDEYYGTRPNWPKLAPKKVEAILLAFTGKWPKVDLPGHWGIGGSEKENAYRFLTEIIWSLNSGDPDEAIPILDQLLEDMRFADQFSELKSIHASQLRRKALKDFEPPTPQEIVDLLDRNVVVSVEGLRQLVIQELEDFQSAIAGSEYNPVNYFYEKGERHDEPRCRDIIAERLSLRLHGQNITVTPEHQLNKAKRSDFTVAKIISGRRRLLVTEVKGQWHPDLYTAATTQLFERYANHQDAEKQGIYLVIWFGVNEKVAGRVNHGIECPEQLKTSIEARLPSELANFINVFVLDVSKSI